MKKDRNCGAVPYPIYQQPMMPNMIGPMPQPNMMMQPNMVQGMPMMQPNMIQGMPSSTNTGSLEQQVNSLTAQVNNLEKRVVALEGLVGTPNYNSNYNNSNFQMI